MKNYFSRFILAFVLIAAVSGCDKLNLFPQPAKKETAKPAVAASAAAVPAPAAVKGTVIAKVNNVPVTLEELNQEIDAYNATVPQDKPELKITTREKKLDYLKNELVRRSLFYQAAMTRGLDKNEDVVKALDKTKQDLLVMALIREETSKIDVASSEVEEYYNNYKEQLKEPEQRQVREIMVPTEQEAKDILIQLLQGADFATIARERSKAPTAANGGDLGLVAPGKKFTQFDQVAFSDTLEVGKTSNIFKGPDGFYIIKLEGKSGGKQKPLSELWDDIKRALMFLKQQQSIETLIGNLSKDAKIEIKEAEVK